MTIRTIEIDLLVSQYEMVEKAIELIQEAKELMDIVMDSDSRLSKEYYAYNEAGIQQALGNGNPYDISLPKILKEIKENGEI
jgi:hypothetical protein